MNKITALAKVAGKYLSDNSPTILTGVAVAGVATTAFLSARAAIPANQSLLEAMSERTEPLTGKEKFQLTYKYFIPPALSCGATILCIVGANTVSTKRTAALMSAYSLTETAYREYQEKHKELYGEKKEEALRSSIAQDRVESNPPANASIIVTGKGETRIYDKPHDRYFFSSINEIDRAINEVTRLCLNDMYVSQNEFYRYLGVPTVSHGDDFGWKSAQEMPDIKYNAVIAPDQEPVISIDYTTTSLNGNLFH